MRRALITTNAVGSRTSWRPATNAGRRAARAVARREQRISIPLRGENASQMQYATYGFKHRYIQGGTYAPKNSLCPSALPLHWSAPEKPTINKNLSL